MESEADAPSGTVTPIETATSDGPDAAHRRPPGLDDDTVEALGKLSEALEVVEHARGYLYGFHRLTGKADLALGEAVDMFRDAGHEDIANRLEREVVGRNVVQGRWTFQIIEEYDTDFYGVFKALEQDARDELAGGRKHLFEAEMKEDRRSHGHPHHEALPGDQAG